MHACALVGVRLLQGGSSLQLDRLPQRVLPGEIVIKCLPVQQATLSANCRTRTRSWSLWSCGCRRCTGWQAAVPLLRTSAAFGQPPSAFSSESRNRCQGRWSSACRNIRHCKHVSVLQTPAILVVISTDPAPGAGAAGAAGLGDGRGRCRLHCSPYVHDQLLCFGLQILTQSWSSACQRRARLKPTQPSEDTWPCN